MVLRRGDHARIGRDRRRADGEPHLILKGEHVHGGRGARAPRRGQGESKGHEEGRSKHPRGADTHPVSVHL